MDRKLLSRQFMAFGLTALGGTLLHFLYDWTGQSILAAPFSGVNESTWEHMKLLFWPMFALSIIQQSHFKARTNYWCVKLLGILTGSILIPVLFYTYNGMFGKSPDWVNISFFFIAAAGAYGLETWLFHKNTLSCKNPRIAIFVMVLISALFIVFTFSPPRIPLFQDPITETYGITHEV